MAPAEIFERVCNIGGMPIVASGLPSCPTLTRFNFIYVSRSVGRPARRGIFQLWSHVCFICCGLQILIVHVYLNIAFKKTKGLILIAIISMCFPPAEAIGYCGP